MQSTITQNKPLFSTSKPCSAIFTFLLNHVVNELIMLGINTRTALSIDPCYEFVRTVSTLVLYCCWASNFFLSDSGIDGGGGRGSLKTTFTVS